jgi:hypothetical protein
MLQEKRETFNSRFKGHFQELVRLERVFTSMDCPFDIVKVEGVATMVIYLFSVF